MDAETLALETLRIREMLSPHTDNPMLATRAAGAAARAGATVETLPHQLLVSFAGYTKRSTPDDAIFIRNCGPKAVALLRAGFPYVGPVAGPTVTWGRRRTARR